MNETSTTASIAMHPVLGRTLFQPRRSSRARARSTAITVSRGDLSLDETRTRWTRKP